MIVEPGIEILGEVESVQGAMHSDEALLDDITGLFDLAEDVVGQPEGLTFITRHQALECPEISVQSPLDELRIQSLGTWGRQMPKFLAGGLEGLRVARSGSRSFAFHAHAPTYADFRVAESPSWGGIDTFFGSESASPREKAR